MARSQEGSRNPHRLQGAEEEERSPQTLRRSSPKQSFAGWRCCNGAVPNQQRVQEKPTQRVKV